MSICELYTIRGIQHYNIILDFKRKSPEKLSTMVILLLYGPKSSLVDYRTSKTTKRFTLFNKVYVVISKLDNIKNKSICLYI